MIRLLGDRVLVALAPKEYAQEPTTGYTYQQRPNSGLIVVATPSDAWNADLATRGIVVKLGEKKGTLDLNDLLGEFSQSLTWSYDEIMSVLNDATSAPFEVAVGDMVLFPPTAGEMFTEPLSDGSIDYLILRESDILAIVDPLPKDEDGRRAERPEPTAA